MEMVVAVDTSALGVVGNILASSDHSGKDQAKCGNLPYTAVPQAGISQGEGN